MSLALKFWGPMTITFNDVTSGSKAYAGLKRDTITINEETLADRFEIENASAIDTEAGRRVLRARGAEQADSGGVPDAARVAANQGVVAWTGSRRILR